MRSWNGYEEAVKMLSLPDERDEAIKVVIDHAEKLATALRDRQQAANAEIVQLQAMGMDLHQIMDEFDNGIMRPDDPTKPPEHFRNRLLGYLRELAVLRGNR